MTFDIITFSFTIYYRELVQKPDVLGKLINRKDFIHKYER